MGGRDLPRYCRCGTRLTAANIDGSCGACQRTAAALLAEPPVVPAEFWETDQLRDAFAAQHIGQLSRAYRKHPHHIATYGGDGITQEVLGRWLGVTQAQISRIENGPPIRTLDSLCYWARTLRIPPRFLWFKLPEEQPTWTAKSAGDRLKVQPYEQLSYWIEHPTSVDLVVAARLREQVHELVVRYDLVRSSSLLADTGQCISQIASLRARASRGDVRRELYAVEAEGATLMGQLLWDASRRRDHATPCAYFDHAIWASRAIRNLAAEGLALLRKSFVALYGEKDPKAGLGLAMQSADVTKRTSHVLTGVATLHAAEAYAMLRQRQSCEQALSKATSHFDKIGTTDAAIDMFSSTRHGRLAGSCYLFLGDAKRAQQILEATAQELQGRSKSEAIVLGNLTLSCIRQRKLDEAMVTLHKAIDVVELTRGGGGLNVIFSAGRELLPFRRVSAVRDVYDRLFSLMAVA